MGQNNKKKEKKVAKEKKRPGRKTHQESIEMEIKVRPFYDNMISVRKCSQSTGYDKDTVNGLYQKWAKETMENNKLAFLDREEHAKEQTLSAMDGPIMDISNNLTYYRNLIQQAKQEKREPKIEWINKVEDLNDKLFAMIEKKGKLEMTPSTKYVVRAEVKEYAAELTTKVLSS